MYGAAEIKRRPVKDWGSTIQVLATAAVGVFTDGYGLGVANIALAILGHLYPSQMTMGDQSFIVSFTLVGVVLGQLIFGFAADQLGRRTCAVATSLLMCIGTLLCASVTVSSTSGSLVAQLASARFLLGVGIGGDYPLSAALAMEVGNDDNLCLTRPQLLIGTNIFFGLGNATQFMLVLFVMSMAVPLEQVWRIAFAMGALPTFLALWLRLKMEEPKKAAQSSEAAVNAGPFGAGRGQILLGCCLGWAAHNMVMLSMMSFSSIVHDSTTRDSEALEPVDSILGDAYFGLSIIICNLAGQAMGLAIERELPRARMQLLAFVGVAVLLLLSARAAHTLASGGEYAAIAARAFDVLYCLTSFVGALVGITTYMLPAESFPASVRGTCVGVAAAAGKVGAAMGAAAFPMAQTQWGLPVALSAGAILALGGAASTAVLLPGARG